jgi:hypothetical protein
VLEASEAVSPVDAVDAVTGEIAAALGATRIDFLIADLSGRALVRLGRLAAVSVPARRGSGSETAEVLPFTDPVIESVVRGQQPLATRHGDGWQILAPVTQRGEVIGLLEVVLPDEPSPSTIESISSAAHALGFVVIANRRHTDLFEWSQRSTPFVLSAEIQRRLLPAALTCEAGAFTLSGWLEPAATIGGDTFDYSLDRDTLHLSITDAMGHGVSSALTATLCVGSLRNTRGGGGWVVDHATRADEALRVNAKNTFCTGMLGRVELRTGVLELVNAGHVLPLLARDDGVAEVSVPINLPFGLAGERGYRSTSVQLMAGDRLVLLTDGMLERQAASLDVPTMIHASLGDHPREATRHLADAVLDAAGAKLDDDASILILDWHGEHGRSRDSHAGANQ